MPDTQISGQVLTKNDLRAALCSRPIANGGVPKWMFDGEFWPMVELFVNRCGDAGIKMLFIKENGK